MDISVKTPGFKIKFDGQEHQIDANTLIANLVHTSTIIQEINNSLNSDKKIEVKIKALEKGSFLIHIELIESLLQGAKNLFTRENITLSVEIITCLIAVIDLIKFLRGKREKSATKENEHTVKIENQNGDTIIINNPTYHIYKNRCDVKEALAKSFKSIEDDTAITGYEITDENENPLVRVDREDFYYYSSPDSELNQNEQIHIEKADLNIVRVSFERRLKWDFYYKGIKITANIKDPSFHEDVENGESFASGDTLQVELKIKKRFDERANTYVNISYTVSKVFNHIKRQQTK